MELHDHCRPPFHQVKTPACMPGTATLIMLLLVITLLTVTGIIVSMSGMSVTGILLFCSALLVVISTGAYYLIKCHTGSLEVRAKILAEIHNLNDVIRVQQNLPTRQNELAREYHGAPNQAPRSATCRMSDTNNDDEIRRLHRIIQVLEQKSFHS